MDIVVSVIVVGLVLAFLGELLIELVLEIVFNLGGEILGEVAGWAFEHRIVRLVLGGLVAFGCGALWTSQVRPDEAPALATGLVAAQGLVVGGFAVGTDRSGEPSGRDRAIEIGSDLVLMGVAFVAGRWTAYLA